MTSFLTTKAVGPQEFTVRTSSRPGLTFEGLLQIHEKAVRRQGGGGLDPCLETEVDCANGSLVIVVTCQQPGETEAEWIQRHRDRVEAAKEACGGQ